MKAKEFVDSLFEGYEKTAALEDFKEELLANLNAKIESLVKKGMDPEAAFAKASAELGDVSAFADELSLKKRTEVFEEAYMDIRKYMPGKRVAAYVIFGAVALFGIVVSVIALFATKMAGEIAVDVVGETVGGLAGEITNSIFKAPINWIAFFGTLMPFLTASIIGYTFLGVTQETASMYPVSKKRGGWYAAAAGMIAFGLLNMPIVYFGTKMAFGVATTVVNNEFLSDVIPHYSIPSNFETLIPVFGLLIPFVLPGIGILVYLILTEKKRLKPWAKSFHYKTMENELTMWNDPATASRFGLYSGAIWIFATGLFILLGFLVGFKFSWLIFVFAVAIQLLVQGVMFRTNK